MESSYIELGILFTISYFFIAAVLVLSSVTLETTIIRILQFSLLMGLFYLIVLQLKETVSFAEGKVSYTDEEVFKFNTNLLLNSRRLLTITYTVWLFSGFLHLGANVVIADSAIIAPLMGLIESVSFSQAEIDFVDQLVIEHGSLFF